MSRETDTPSPGPNGRGGGAAYPSGTPPYGTPMVSDGGADAGRSAAQPEERKTETTVTTRVRINIPGSRPIPPVVVRKPVGEGEGDDTAAEPQSAAPQPAPEAPAAEPAAEKNDWFAPRRPSGPKSNGAGIPGASTGTIGAQASAPGTGSGTAPARPAGGAIGGARPGGVVGSMPAPGKRPGGTNGAGLPGGATGGPVAPGHGGGTGSFDVTEVLAATSPRANAPEPTRDELPYFSEPESSTTAQHDFSDQHNFAAPNTGYPDPAAGNGKPARPNGPTAGPVTGGTAVPQAGLGAPGTAPGPGGPGLTHGLTAPGANSGANPAAGRLPGGGLSDDTAILTPQKLAPNPGPNGLRPGGPGAHGGLGAPGGPGSPGVSGQTLTSGIPVVPPVTQSTPPQQSAPAKGKKQKKGRGKLTLLVGLVVVAGAGVYGAGLLMNHSDVPKGTTVLGVDIGGSTRDEAVKKLDDVFGPRALNAKLKLTVGGKQVTLQPDQAGLQFDIPATVDSVAKSDYNPVTVVGALFGQKRVVEPDMPVDEEKLQAALENASGGSASSSDGTIKFEDGKAVAVYGKPGAGIDTAKALPAVEEAYRKQVETGIPAPVTVPTTTKQPTVSNAEVDRMMKEFAEPAMSERVTIEAPNGKGLQFGARSLPKIISFKAVNGKLVDTYDLEALKEIYGSTFDGVQVTTATGKRDILPQDVVNALRKALVGKTTAERTVVIETNPS
ncbi:hypothetical protein IAG44_13725 [Streptomyces roseirectus]|uniref:Peptidoglycan binding domain-containing protein n=1 Tax=Streptomyces roseirectus TaxID=2768066 RepID=A0A7H0IC83_9ACTN|nr:hypothetical protein [Streptomyces roseirectus]QNP70399.1 hypothetical protein IAG44_13725 [Streptomyces roseirectus]